MDEIKSTFKQYFEIAPQNIREMIKRISDKPEIVAEIAHRQNLAEIMFDALEVEIFLVLLGVEPLSAFRANLVEELDVTYDQALKISLDTNISIFGPIMETLKNMEQGLMATSQATPSAEKTRPSSGGAEDILRAQVDKNSGGKPSTTPQNGPTPLLMDHAETEKIDGVHLHSQSVMPSNASSAQNFSKPAPSVYTAPKPTYTAPKSEPVATMRPVAVAQPVTPTIATARPDTTNPGILSHINPEQPKSSFRSIVDEKLSSLVRSTHEATTMRKENENNETVSRPAMNPDVKKYPNGQDPYREPLQ